MKLERGFFLLKPVFIPIVPWMKLSTPEILSALLCGEQSLDRRMARRRKKASTTENDDEICDVSDLREKGRPAVSYTWH